MSGGRKVLLLTGASRGIGHATVKRFSDTGAWRIITCSRDAVPEECKRDPNWSHHITADLGNSLDLDRFVVEASALVDGALHALVNNAGVSPKSPSRERLGCLNGDLEAWREVFQLNFFVPLILSRAFSTPLAAAKGAIVNITSIAGHHVHPFCRLGLRDIESRAVGVDAGDGLRFRAAVRPRQRGCSRRNQDGNAVS